MSPGRLLIGALGVASIALGAVLTVQTTTSLREWISIGAWLLVPPVVLDLIVLPGAALITVAISRWLPMAWRTPVTVGAVLTGFVALIGWPFIGGFGQRSDNTSLLNRDYTLATIVLLALIWTACLIAGLIRAGRTRNAAPLTSPDGSSDDGAHVGDSRTQIAGRS